MSFLVRNVSLGVVILPVLLIFFFFFFFQAEDGIRDKLVTGVQTCALPISGWGAADVALGSKAGASAAKWRKDVGAAPDESDKGWLQELSSWALAQNVVAPPDDLDVLVQAVERGLPPKTHLILVAESLPPKHPLVRLAGDKGAHVRRRAERRGRT